MGSRRHKRTKAERKVARVLRRDERQKEFLVRRLEKELAFTEILPQPLNAGDRCWKCGTVLVWRATRRTKRPSKQQYAYRGYLHCVGCKRNYFFDRDKYWLTTQKPKQESTESLEHQVSAAIDNDRTDKPRTIVDLMRERERENVAPRLIKRQPEYPN